MFQNFVPSAASLALLIFSTSALSDDLASQDEVSEITVTATRVANEQPASTYATAATQLRFDPLTELQSRGLAEGQSDVTVRGGLFENTGFQLGAITVIDPQTGHYVAELPVDPALLSSPQILTGVDSAVVGFNSAIATVAYQFNPITDGGHVGVGAGSDSLNYQTLRYGRAFESTSGATIGAAFSAARSEGDGSVEFGDHEFARYNLQLQRATTQSRSDLIIAYQDKFFGWPGAYTGFATLPEIDDTQTTLILANHRQETERGWFEVGGFYRRLEDDYDFNRTTFETGAPGSFEHETKVSGIGFQGLHQAGDVAWRYGGQFTQDELVFSTDLTNGSFNDRNYITLSVAPEIEFALANGHSLTTRLGVSFDDSNRDDSEVSPLFGLALSNDNGNGTTIWSLEYAATSQLPGYTVLNSNPTGLFGGNADLGRETARQVSLGFQHDSADWQTKVTLFSREDDDLVDWTYATGAPFARQANAVDLDVIGIEAYLIRSWDSIDIAVGAVVLDKDADYGSATVDASFYALNFARQRGTVALTWRFAPGFELRLDNEYRNQEDNPLRVGDDNAYLASASLRWAPGAIEGLDVRLLVDNVTDSEYQPFPGTPASGRQTSLGVSYNW